MKIFTVIILSCYLNFWFCNSSKPEITPIVLWHGAADSCCFPWSLGALKKNIEKALPGVYVLSLKIGGNVISDLVHTLLFLHPDKQVEYACRIIQSDPALRNGFNAVGLSQGSQLMRALIQRCSGVRVKNLITLGGQHQGIYGVPLCPGSSSKICDFIRKIVNHAAYNSWVQKIMVQATFWHDPLDEKKYKIRSTFMADINNELNMNETYKKRLSSLNKFVMVKFLDDKVIEPRDSEWFGFYTPGQGVDILDLQQSVIYKEDRLGLKQMNEDGKLMFIATKGDHLEFSWKWFKDNILNPYLSN